MKISEIENIKTLIGTDISIDVCVREGYTIIDTENKEFNREENFRIMQFYPDYVLEEMGHDDIDELDRFEFMIIDTEYSFNELVEIYNKHKQGMDSSCETHIHVNFTQPTFYDFLNLASDCSGYCGL